MQANFRIMVVYSPGPRELLQKELSVEHGCTAEQALQLSGLMDQVSIKVLPDIELGVWGRRVAGTHKLRPDDRVEVYRSLRVDPKVARRERFTRQGTKSAGLFAKRRPGAKPGY